MFITSLDHPEYDKTYNRYDGYNNPVILHAMWCSHLGRFPSMEKLEEFLDFAGIKMGVLVEEQDRGDAGIYRQWTVDTLLDDAGFMSLDELPEEAKPFTGLSNGHLVTCYLWNDGETLHIRRPNPNVKDIYKPLSTEEHIAYCRKNGYV